MLIMFRAKNYLSFKDEIVLDMRKSSYKDNMTNLHTNIFSDTDILKTMAICGLNASGKTNFIKALGKFKEILCNSFFEEDDPVYIQSKNKNNFPLEPFNFSDKLYKNIEFEIVFKNENIFHYGFEICEKNIVSEWLFVDGETVFNRKENNLIFGQKYIHILENFSNFRNDRLSIATLDYFTSEDIFKKFKEFFYTKLNIHIEFFPTNTTTYSELLVSLVSLNKKTKNRFDFKNKILKYLGQIDIGICDLEIEDISNEIKTIHKIFDKEGVQKGTKKIDLKDESPGTLKFIILMFYMLEMLESGGTFFIDDISSNLHPVLTKFIIDLLQSDLNQKSQLIFTTHEIPLMTKEQVIKDKIMIMHKNQFGASKLYSLSAFNSEKIPYS